MNIGKAFTYAFEDKEWTRKLGILLVVLLVPILNFAGVGYSIDIMRRIVKGQAELLPDWDDLGKKFLDGLLLGLASIIYALPILLLACLPLALILVPILLAGNSNSQDIANAMGGASAIAFACLGCFAFVYGLALSVLFPAIYIKYAAEGTFAACFNFKEIFAVMRRNTGAYFTAWIVYVGVSFGAGLVGGLIGGLISWIPCIGQLAVFIISFGAAAYTLVVFAHMFGEYSLLPPANAQG